MNNTRNSRENGFMSRAESYSTLCSAWTSLVAANNSLLNGHMIAHSFIIVACATLLASQGRLSSMALAIVSGGGLVLGILLSATWPETLLVPSF